MADCKEASISNDYADFIYDYESTVMAGIEFPEDSCIQQIAIGMGVYYGERSRIPDIDIQFYGYFSIPRLYTILDTSSMEASGILKIINQPLLGLSGKDVLIGFIDTGIDYTNPVFFDELGNSRIEGIWDQTDQTGQPPLGIFYGSEYTGEDIRRALRQPDPLSVVPQTDDDGHGTFMASIAAGRLDIENDFTGAAPQASIAMVKLKPAKQYLKDFYLVSGDEPIYQENDIMTGVKYLLNLQRRLKMPMVICVGLGTNNGGHTGGAPLGVLLDYVCSTIGTSAVISVGNEANAAHHFLGAIQREGEYEDVEIRVPEGQPGFTVELWAQAPEQYSIEIISPSGETTDRIPVRIGGSGVYRYVLDRSTAFVDYEIFQSGTGNQLIFVRLATPSAGIWTLRVFNDYFINGNYHVWLPITGVGSDEVVFLQPNPNTTIVIPSTAQRAISVAAYNHVNGSIYINSSRGFTRNNAIKPDITAPGVNVYGALPDGRFTRRSGTSVAAAHVAGAAALILEWGINDGNIPLMTNSDIKTIITRGAIRSPDITYPSRVWGYGILDLYSSFEKINR
ncbi:MAG: S8 family peptidase [Lachnospiraceae bacterium]|nr:S8 family peptidase [Lachnospiraceae bacterium]